MENRGSFKGFSYIYIYIYIDKIGNTFSLFVTRKIVPNLINPLVQIP